jgi:hypothetical protein
MEPVSGQLVGPFVTSPADLASTRDGQLLENGLDLGGDLLESQAQRLGGNPRRVEPEPIGHEVDADADTQHVPEESVGRAHDVTSSSSKMSSKPSA